MTPKLEPDVLVAEQPIVRALDECLSELFAPDRAFETAQEIVAASTNGPDRSERIQRLAARSRPHAEKEQADTAHRVATELAPPELLVEEVLAAVERCGGFTGVLEEATDTERATLYASMGVSAVYNPDRGHASHGRVGA